MPQSAHLLFCPTHQNAHCVPGQVESVWKGCSLRLEACKSRKLHCGDGEIKFAAGTVCTESSFLKKKKISSIHFIQTEKTLWCGAAYRVRLRIILHLITPFNLYFRCNNICDVSAGARAGQKAECPSRHGGQVDKRRIRQETSAHAVLQKQVELFFLDTLPFNAV